MNRMRLAQRSAAVLLSALVLQATCLPYFHSAARADEAPSVAVLPVVKGYGAPDGAPERFRALVEETLSRRDALSIIKQPEADAAADSGDTPSSGADPAALLDEGQKKLSDLDFAAASDLLHRGITQMTAAPEHIQWPKLLDAYVSLAVASFRRGDEESAQKALGSLVRLSPGFQLPEGRFPPVFVREFQKAKKRVERMPRGTILVEGPPGAVAWVNDVNLGMVPVSQENLTAGTHYVRVEGTRGELFGAAHELRSREAKVVATFSPRSTPSVAVAQSPGAVGPILDANAAQAAHAACQKAGAQFAVVGVLYRSGEHQVTAATAVYSARARGFIPLPTFAFDHELLTANVEAYRLADAVERTVLGFGRPAAPGHDLAKGATWRAGQPQVAVRTDPVAEPITRRSAITPGAEPSDPAQEGRLRALEGGAVDADLAARGDRPVGGEVKSGSKWWLWTLVGVGVVAAAGGTAYGVHQASQPVTGTVTARW